MPTDKTTAERARQLLGEGHRERAEDVLLRQRLENFGKLPEDEKPAKKPAPRKSH